MRQRAMIAMALLFTPGAGDHGRADLRARRRRPALADGADQGAAAASSASRSSSSRTTCRWSATSPTDLLVMYAGQVVEFGTTREPLRRAAAPLHDRAARGVPVDPRTRRRALQGIPGTARPAPAARRLPLRTTLPVTAMPRLRATTAPELLTLIGTQRRCAADLDRGPREPADGCQHDSR